MLVQMEALSSLYYDAARAIGFHQFVEINGLIQKIVKSCRAVLQSGRDFGEYNVTLEDHDAHYIGEKMGCIWGDALLLERNFKAFLSGMFNLPIDVRAEGHGVIITIGNPNKEVTGDAEKEGNQAEGDPSP